MFANVSKETSLQNHAGLLINLPCTPRPMEHNNLQVTLSSYDFFVSNADYGVTEKE